MAARSARVVVIQPWAAPVGVITTTTYGGNTTVVPALGQQGYPQPQQGYPPPQQGYPPPQQAGQQGYPPPQQAGQQGVPFTTTTRAAGEA
ncbi:cysteine-rich and transmembrane domain-containing protein B-like [Strongylocentrotus purpuratus]|uniref:Uncharacterized protein n=1 Tax=Strongylocentrotus purpuratus TaxID=7668 RepID=A0A7M7SW99_STRPU|nr:cysteine-rich and transmembrane domain-containing protein B-like [Strongylocentrotus purpuratus]